MLDTIAAASPPKKVLSHLKRSSGDVPTNPLLHSSTIKSAKKVQCEESSKAF